MATIQENVNQFQDLPQLKMMAYLMTVWFFSALAPSRELLEAKKLIHACLKNLSYAETMAKTSGRWGQFSPLFVCLFYVVRAY